MKGENQLWNEFSVVCWTLALFSAILLQFSSLREEKEFSNSSNFSVYLKEMCNLWKDILSHFPFFLFYLVKE